MVPQKRLSSHFKYEERSHSFTKSHRRLVQFFLKKGLNTRSYIFNILVSDSFFSKRCPFWGRERMVSFPLKNNWNPTVLTKEGFFVWEASWGKVLTLDQLQRRGRSLVNQCFLCTNVLLAWKRNPSLCLSLRHMGFDFLLA